jgi:large subunit ribosomal protein L22
MNYTHVQKNVGHTPRKLRLLVDMVKKMDPYKAVETLEFTNKLAAPTLAKAIKSAVANAGHKENLSFNKIEINEGLKMKRIAGTGGRGRPRFIKRRMSHIKIVLTDDAKGES